MVIPRYLLYLSIFLQVISYILLSVDVIYYLTGVLVIDPLNTINGYNVFEISIVNYLVLQTIPFLSIWLYGLTVTFYPVATRFHHRMRLFGGTIVAFALHFLVFSYLRIRTLANLDFDTYNSYASQQTLVSGILFLVLIVITYFLPRQMDAEKNHRRAVIITGITSAVVFMGFSYIAQYLAVLLQVENIELFYDFASTVSLGILSVAFIIIILSTIKVYNEMSLTKEEQQLYPDTELLVMKN